MLDSTLHQRSGSVKGRDKKTPRRVRLGTVDAGGIHLDSISVRLAGRHVATAGEYTASAGDALGAFIEVRDLRTSRVRHRFESPSEPITYEVTDLELRLSGSVAWIARVLGGMPAVTTFEVRVSQGGASPARWTRSGPTKQVTGSFVAHRPDHPPLPLC